MTAKERYAAYLAKRKPATRDAASEARNAEPVVRDAEPGTYATPPVIRNMKPRNEDTCGSVAKLTLLDYRKFLLKLLSLHEKGCGCVHCTEIRRFLPERKHKDVPHGFVSLVDASRLYGYTPQALTKAISDGRLKAEKYRAYKIVAISEIERYVREMNARKAENLARNRFRTEDKKR